MTGGKRNALPSQDRLRQMFDLNEETGRLIWRARPDRSKQHNARWAGKMAGERHPLGYFVIRTGGVRFLAHRLVWKWLHGDEPENLDHRNGDGFDNRPSNLRSCTHQENMRNTAGWAKKTLPKGVHLRAESGRFRAIICINRRNINLGTFDTSSEAAAAYRAAATQQHGQFARFA